MKLLVLLSFILSLGYSLASDNNGQGEDEPGKTDADGKKQGHWIVKGKHEPAKNYPAEDKIREGDYKDNRKVGEWTFYYVGNVPKTKTTFVNGRPTGKYFRYHVNGNVKEEGEMRAGRQVGPQTQYFEDGKVKRKQTYSPVGRPVGEVVEYHPNGQVALKANIDPKTFKRTEATWFNDDGSEKKSIKYGPDGTPTDVKEGVVKEKAEVGTGQAATKPVGTVTKDGKPFKPDGFNMLYKNDELYQVGTFKGGKLWDGKFYKYDADGLLLKIEIYKGGKYHSDGQM